MYDRDELLARTDLRELATELLGPPKGHGRSATWPSPVPGHSQTGKTPPMSIFTTYRGVERWTCFATGTSGTAIDLVMLVNGCTVREAFVRLARRAGFREPIEVPAAPRSRRRPPPPAPAEPSPAIEEYVAACERLLWRPEGRAVRRWLMAERGFSEQVLRANRVGADPGPRVLLRARGLPRRGLGAVLPVLADDDHAIYCQTRYLSPGDGPKYGNPTAELAPNPRLAVIRAVGQRPGEPVIVTEGLPDALTAAALGYDVRAVLGVGMPDTRVAERLARAGRPLAICYDADDRGQDGARRLHQLLSALESPARVTNIVPPPDAPDLTTGPRGSAFSGQRPSRPHSASQSAARARWHQRCNLPVRDGRLTRADRTRQAQGRHPGQPKGLPTRGAGGPLPLPFRLRGRRSLIAISPFSGRAKVAALCGRTLETRLPGRGPRRLRFRAWGSFSTPLRLRTSFGV